MNELFKNTNPAMRFLTNVANLILVNLLFLITCIPIVTIGASLCALYKISFEILEQEEVFVIKDYFKTFFKKFKNSTLLWIPMAVIDALMFYAMIIVNSGLEGTAKWMMIPPWIVVLLSVCILIYAFPYTANYDDTIKGTVSKCIIMGAGALPTTFMLAVIHVVVIDIMLSVNTVQVVLGSLLLFIGCGAIALLCSVFVRRVFKKFLVVENEEDEEPSDPEETDEKSEETGSSENPDADDNLKTADNLTEE